MLTKIQLMEAIRAVSLQGTLDIADAMTVYDMANAYERVAALLAEVRAQGSAVVTDAELERALEG